MAKKNTEETEGTPELDNVKLTKALIRELNKDEETKGKVAWSLATDIDNPTEIREWISTGSTLLDYVISNRRDGGVPVGKLTELSGEEASGKSLVCMHLAAECQRRGGIVVYIDTENAINPEFATQIGVDLTKLVYLQPGTCEEVWGSIERLIVSIRQKAKSKLVLIIWDGIAATPTQKEIEGEQTLGMDAQLEKSKVLSKMLRVIMQPVGKERIALVFTNQLKTKIGSMYGDPMTTPGGKAVPYHASVRVRLTRGTTEKSDEKDVLGVNTSAKVVKNRCGPPLRKASFFISFARGIEDKQSWFFKLHERGFIEKSDGWCFLPSVPSGTITVKKGASYDGTDRGMKFREKAWAEFLEETAYSPAQVAKLHAGEKPDVVGDPAGQKLVDIAKDALEHNMVVKYGVVPPDAEHDEESLMETEQLIQDLVDVK